MPSNDPYFGNVVALLHMEDTGITDLKGKTVTKYGNAARSNAQAKFGSYACGFDGNGDYLQYAAAAGPTARNKSARSPEPHSIRSFPPSVLDRVRWRCTVDVIRFPSFRRLSHSPAPRTGPEAATNAATGCRSTTHCVRAIPRRSMATRSSLARSSTPSDRPAARWKLSRRKRLGGGVAPLRANFQ